MIVAQTAAAAATTITSRTTTTTSTRTLAAVPAADLLSPEAANPPPTTRPPPLQLPSKPDPAPPLFSRPGFSHLYATGLAYLKFYKTGLRHVLFTNTRLLFSPDSSSSSAPPPPLPGTRAHLHLRLRWRHDIRRLPLFAVILLVCGELTPLAVLALPRAVPLACRIPRQVDGLLRTAEDRRAEARAEAQAQAAARWLEEEEQEENGPAAAEEEENAEVPVPVLRALAKVLGLPARPWTPGFVLRHRIHRRLRFLAADDALLLRAGGAAALVEDELRLACADRAIDVRGRLEHELRHALAAWLRLTDPARLEGGERERERVVLRLLLLRDSEWQEKEKGEQKNLA
ncbi:hypothetical protein VTH82DRAFT_6434 [Thermothelomyces myriococcoides]